jgi:glycosyltransferase involved in cell wall biosynthesis
MTIQVSVVIPTFNRVEHLRRCLEALEAQTLSLEQYEVIVVDDGSSDNTLTFLESVSTRAQMNLRYYRQPNQGPAAARNLGIQEAQGELIALTDDDCLPASDWLAALITSLPDERRCAGIGGSIVRLRDSFVSRYMDDCEAMQHLIRNGEVLYLVTANAMYRRSCLIEVGGFDRRISWPGGEDPDLSYRLRERGYYLTTTHKAMVKHDHRDTFRGLYKMFWLHGRGNCARAQFGRFPAENRAWWQLLVQLTYPLKYIIRGDLNLYERVGFCVLHYIHILGHHFGYVSCPDVTNAVQNLSV